jgi:hypothetical protein
MDPAINLEPIDPEAMKADLRQALVFCDTGRTDLAIESLLAYRAKLQVMLANLVRLEKSLETTSGPDELPNPNKPE